MQQNVEVLQKLTIILYREINFMWRGLF